MGKKTKDDNYLDDYVENASYEDDKTKTKKVLKDTQDDTATLGDLVEEVGTVKTARVQERAERVGAANSERVSRAQAKLDEHAQDTARRRTRSQQEALGDALQSTASTVQQTTSDLAQRIGSVQTVGGIGLLLAILVLLLFAIVSVNSQGDTRLKQLWYMLNGRTTLAGSVNPAIIGGEAGGGFGDTSVPMEGFGGRTDVNGAGGSFATNGQYRTVTGGGF